MPRFVSLTKPCGNHTGPLPPIPLRLQVFATVFYAWPILGTITTQSMQRLTAKFLLLFTLVGTFVPLALAVTVAPTHSCCIRKAAHQCRSSFTESDQRAVRSTACCNHNCCRAVTTSQSAHPGASPASVVARNLDIAISDSYAETPASELFALRSSRAPPRVSLA